MSGRSAGSNDDFAASRPQMRQQERPFNLYGQGKPIPGVAGMTATGNMYTDDKLNPSNHSAPNDDSDRKGSESSDSDRKGSESSDSDRKE